MVGGDVGVARGALGRSRRARVRETPTGGDRGGGREVAGGVGRAQPRDAALATHAGAKRSDEDVAAAAASEKKRRSRAEGMEHVSALSKELDTRARVFEDDADFIVEVREGSSDADLDPNFELKNLGLRFENWKRDFKDRLRETRLMLKRLDKLENGIGGDDAFDDAYAYGYREDAAHPSREDA